MRNFFFWGFFVMDSYKFLLVCGLDAEKKLGGVSRWFLQGVLRIFVCFVVVNRGEVVVDSW